MSHHPVPYRPTGDSVIAADAWDVIPTPTPEQRPVPFDYSAADMPTLSPPVPVIHEVIVHQPVGGGVNVNFERPDARSVIAAGLLRFAMNLIYLAAIGAHLLIGTALGWMGGAVPDPAKRVHLTWIIGLLSLGVMGSAIAWGPGLARVGVPFTAWLICWAVGHVAQDRNPRPVSPFGRMF